MAQNDTTLVFGAVDKVTPVLRGIQTEVGKMSGAFSSLANVAGGLIGVLGTRAIVNFGRSLIDAGDQVNTVAKRLNIAASSFSAMGYAVKQAGSDVSTLQTGLTALSRQIADAANGGKAAEIFEDLGIAVRDANGEIRKVDDVLKDLATKFKNSKDGAGELAVASKLLGRAAGPELVQFLNQGKVGIEELEERARRLGIVISDDFAKQSDQFNDNLATLGEIAKGVGRTFIEELLPNVNQFTKVLVDQRAELDQTGTSVNGFAVVFRSVARFFIEVAKYSEIALVGVASFVDRAKIEFDNLGSYAEIAQLEFSALAAKLSGNFGSANAFTQAAEQATQALNERLKPAIDGVQEAADDTFADIDKKYAPRLAAFSGALANFGNVVSKVSGNAVEAEDDIASVAGGCRRAGDAAAKAAPKVKDLGIAVEKLVDPSAEIIDLLSRTAAEMGGPVVAAALEYRDQLVKIAELQAALLAQGPPTAEAAGQFEALGRAAKKLGEDYQSVQAGNIAANDDFVDSTRDTALEVKRAWENLTFALTDVFRDFISGAINSWDDFGRSLQRISDTYLDNISRSFQSTVLTPGGGGAAAFGQSINSQSMFGPGGTGFTVGGALGAAGSAYGGYQAAEQGNAAGSILQFAAAGAQIGGIYGAIIGAVVGAIAYALAKPDIPALNLIGDDIVGTDGFRNLAPGSSYESRLGGFTFASIDEVDRETRDQLGAAVVSFDNAIAQILDSDQLERVRGALADWNLRLEDEAITAENILESRFNAILSTFSQDIQDFVNLGADFEERFSRLGQKLEFPRLLADMLEGLAEADTVAGLSETERQIRQINLDFDELATTAETLGATQEELTKIEEYRVNALNRVAEATARALGSLTDDIVFEDSIAALSDYEKEVARVNRYYEDLTARAIELGASQEILDAIERTRVRRINELTEAQESNIETMQEMVGVLSGLDQLYDDSIDQQQLAALRDAAEGIRDFLDNLAFSPTSSLSPADRFNAAQEQFRDIARRAAGGDLGAIGDLTGAAQNLLTEGRSFFGATDQFSALERFVRDALTPFGQLDQANSLPHAIDQLREVLELLNRTLTGNIATGGPGAGNVVYLNAVRDNTTAVNSMKTAVVAELRRLGGNTSRVG